MLSMGLSTEAMPEAEGRRSLIMLMGTEFRCSRCDPVNDALQDPQVLRGDI